MQKYPIGKEREVNMPITVIVELKMVDIQHNQRQFRPYSHEPRIFTCQNIVKVPAISNSGKTISITQISSF